jgi:hypothetical protein
MARIQRGWQNSLIILLVLILLSLSTWFVWQRWFASPTPSTPASGLSSLHQGLIAKPESIKGNWLHTLNPKAQDVQGDLVWDNTSQRGVMQFSNLPAAPADQRYQLWIYDTNSTTEQPISAAQFTQGAERNPLWIELVPTQPVKAPYKFVLQLESIDNATEPQILLMVQP